jgi:hypothetical protein
MTRGPAEFGRAFVRFHRPNPLVVGWRWRYELTTAVTAVALAVRIGALWTVGSLLAVAAAVAVLKPLRWRAWCVLTPHRIRSACRNAWLCSGTGRLPMVLWTRPVGEGERVLLLLRPGISAEDVAVAAPVLAAACWAREVLVEPHPTRAQLVALTVVRYDAAAYPASAA